ncbi:MAG: ABC transporter permease [Pyrinomonadaceae bacterium]|nr:ABC transporter permease [Acidobacteriota bacterium]MBK7932842.1 ABC transporter permease [Acidobacteriota bacterium]MBP7415295.1 ABC transporter permease [Pyrinomonadaceae bacterium]
MKPWDLVKLANRNLFRNKLRTFLTVAAIFVGSFTLTMTNGIGDGLRSYVESQVKNIEGDTVVFVRRKIERPEGAPRGDAPPEYKDETSTPATAEIDPTAALVTLAQMESVLKDVPDVKTVTPRYEINGEYITLDGQKKFELELGMISQGVSQKVEAGKTISGPGQIVIPIGLAKELDADFANLIGKTATIGYKASDRQMRTLSLRIVGVATKGFMTMTNSFVDSQTAASIYAAQRDPSEAGKFFSFSVQLSSADQAKIVAVKKKLDEKGFSAETIADQQKRTYDAIGIFKIGMSLVAFIALLAASFGIINTLVIAVLERTKEIGLQKALGMGRGKIFAVFSLESVLIGFWGALLGIVGGIIVGLVANQVLMRAYAASFEGYTLFVFTVPSIILVMLIVCSIAFVAGVMPAIRASRLNPIESLRYE